MRHSKRRQETGKMLMDVVKYLLTVGLVGSALSDKFDVKTVIFVIIAGVVIYLIAFFTIPPEQEGTTK